MKKFASVLLAVLVAFSMFSFVVSAANAKVTLTADKTNVNVGDKVVVTVALAEKSGLGTLTIKANYDSSVLKAVDMKAGTLGATVNAKTGIATMAAAETFEDAGTICVMTFEALKAGTANVTFTVDEATDANFDAKTVDVSSVKVTVAGAAVEEPTTEEPTTEEPTTEEPSTEAPSVDEDPCADGHKWSTWAVEKVAECKKDGVKARNCSVCGEKETEVIPATGECAYKWVVTKEATATEYGEKVLKCTMCGHVKETQKLAVKNDSADSLDKPAIPNTDAIA
jgi:hypothetical protein